MRAWSLIKTMDDSFKSSLVKAVRGGSKRDGTGPAVTGRQVLDLYQRREAEGRKAVETDWRSFRKLF